MHWEFSMHLARQGIAPGALTRGDADAVVRNALPIGSVPRRRFLVADGERRAGPAPLWRIWQRRDRTTLL